MLDQLSAYTRTEGVATPEDVTLCYDASGNVSGQSTNTANVCGAPVRAYTHDAQNRMTAASDSVTAMNASYVYGAEESRIYKQGGSAGVRFANLNDQVLGEHPGTAGSALGSWRLIVPGIGVDDRVAMVDMSGSTATAVHYYLPNRIGSIVGMVDTAGVLTDQYLYSPFGVEEPLAGSGNAYRYTGRYYDAETGLYYYRARYYDPGLGRFGSPDPILYDDQWNTYAYVGNNPINNVDPMGTDTRTRIIGIDTTGLSKLPVFGHAFLLIEDTESNRSVVLRAGSINGAGISNGGAASLLTSPSESSGSDGAGGNILTQVNKSFESPDVQRVLKNGLFVNTLADTTTGTSFDESLAKANDFTTKVNGAGVSYDALMRNSNSTTGTAFEQVTGQDRPENTLGIYPGFDRDLCEEDVKC